MTEIGHEKRGAPGWIMEQAAEKRALIPELVEAYRKQWGSPQKPLLADAHALLDASILSEMLLRNSKLRRNEHALIWTLRKEVLRQLSAGDLAAEGLRDPMGEPAHIPADRWPLFQVNFDGSEASAASIMIVGIRVSRPSAEVGEKPPHVDAVAMRPRRGRAPTVDWATIKELVRISWRENGPICLEGPPGWQIQAHVERLIASALEDRREQAVESTIRRHAKTIIAELSQEAEKSAGD